MPKEDREAAPFYRPWIALLLLCDGLEPKNVSVLVQIDRQPLMPTNNGCSSEPHGCDTKKHTRISLHTSRCVARSRSSLRSNRTTSHLLTHLGKWFKTNVGETSTLNHTRFARGQHPLPQPRPPTGPERPVSGKPAHPISPDTSPFTLGANG